MRSTKRRKSERSKEVRVIGMEGFFAALQPVFLKVAGEIQIAERDRMIAELVAAREKSTRELIASFREAKKRQRKKS